MDAGTDISALIGTVVAKRFRIDSLLGAGAMGVVFRAVLLPAEGAADSALTASDDSAIALKIVLPDRSQQRAVPRLLRGARLAAQFRHPHVVETLSHGRLGKGNAGYYVAMELVEGVPLSRLAATELSVGALCTLMCQVLDALAFMHAHNVLHRDIKPENILVTRADDGSLQCKISDFGIAAETVTDATYLTQPGTVIGTPIYMAPEQMQGRGRDTPALDLYPVGVILYELISGKLPFSGSSLTSLMAKLSEDPPRPQPRAGQELPEELVAAIMRLLARDPGQRYPFAADAGTTLARFATPATLPEDEWRALVDWDQDQRRDLELPEGWSASADSLAAGTGEPLAEGELGGMPLIGRDEVLDELDDMAHQAEQQHIVSAALLCAGVGMGKSTLLRAITARLASCARFQPLRTSFHAATSTSDALRQALDGALGTTGRSRAHVDHAIADLQRRTGVEDHDELAALGAFLRPAPGDQSTQGEVFALMHRGLRRLAGVRPVLLLLDDLSSGGADAASFLDYLLFQTNYEPFPMFIVGTLDDGCKNPRFRGALERSTRFDSATRRIFRLGPLDESTLAGALRQHLGLGPTSAHRIARQSAGNPLYAMLMARAQRDQDSADNAATSSSERRAAMDVALGATAAAPPMLAAGSGDSRRRPGTESETAERLPRALREILSVNLERQLARSGDPDRFRALLEAVAVLGATVDASLLSAYLSADAPRPQLDDELDRCIDLELLEWSEVGGAEFLSFRPAVRREVVLAGLNPRRARRLHRQAIDVRPRWAGPRVGAEAGALGEHCEAVGQLGEAVEWWLRGQSHEREGGDHLLSVEWGRRALAAMERDDPRYGPCAIALGRTLLDAGELERAAEVLRPVAYGSDTDLAMKAGDVLGDVYENSGDSAAWRALIEALSEREDQASPDARRYLFVARSMWNAYHGCRKRARSDAETALADAAPGEQTQRAAQRLAFVEAATGNYERAEEIARRAVEASGERSDLRTRSVRLLGIVLASVGRTEEALALQREVLALCRRSGLLARIPMAMIDIGTVLVALGQLDEGLAELRAAERTAAELGLASAQRTARFRALACEFLRGDVDSGLARLRAEFEHAARAGWSMPKFYNNLLLAWAHAYDGDLLGSLEVLNSLRSADEYPAFLIEALVVRDLTDRLLQLVSSGEIALDDEQRRQSATLIDGMVRYLERMPIAALPPRAQVAREQLAYSA